jgi:hypothetical protein
MKNLHQPKQLFFAAFLVAAFIMLTTQACNEYKRQGYVSLFNGRDLTGWVIPEGDNGHWKVLDGVIDYDAQSEAEGEKNLWTEAEFGDFQLHIEWRFKTVDDVPFSMNIILHNGDEKTDENGEVIVVKKPNADSGILLKGAGQANLWCWNVGSGELWGVRRNKDNPPEVRAGAVPLVNADNPVGEWNVWDMTLKGDRITIVSNGQLIIDNALFPGMPEKGRIGLQHHGHKNPETGEMMGGASQVQFRNIWIKEI